MRLKQINQLSVLCSFLSISTAFLWYFLIGHFLLLTTEGANIHNSALIISNEAGIDDVLMT